MEADGVSCNIVVVYGGSSPICIVYGKLMDVEQPAVTAPITMQLVGWMAFAADEDNIVPIKDGFMHFDRMPEQAALIAAWHSPEKDFRTQAVALQPIITEL